MTVTCCSGSLTAAATTWVRSLKPSIWVRIAFTSCITSEIVASIRSRTESMVPSTSATILLISDLTPSMVVVMSWRAASISERMPVATSATSCRVSLKSVWTIRAALPASVRNSSIACCAASGALAGWVVACARNSARRCCSGVSWPANSDIRVFTDTARCPRALARLAVSVRRCGITETSGVKAESRGGRSVNRCRMFSMSVAMRARFCPALAMREPIPPTLFMMSVRSDCSPDMNADSLSVIGSGSSFVGRALTCSITKPILSDTMVIASPPALTPSVNCVCMVADALATASVTCVAPVAIAVCALVTSFMRWPPSS